jgi:hypothetical protein
MVGRGSEEEVLEVTKVTIVGGCKDSDMGGIVMKVGVSELGMVVEVEEAVVDEGVGDSDAGELFMRGGMCVVAWMDEVEVVEFVGSDVAARD